MTLFRQKRKTGKHTTTIAIFLCISIVLSGCRQQVKALHPYAQEFLYLMGIEQSRILDCDFKKIRQWKTEIQPVDFTELIGFIINDYFSVYYDLEEKDVQSTISENDLVQMSIMINDGDEVLYQSEETFMIAADNGKLYSELQTRLIGQHTGFAGTGTLPITEEWTQLGFEGKTISYTVTKVFACTLRSAIFESSLNSEGITSPSEFFLHLFRQHVKDQSLEKRFSAREKFISEALANCQIVYDTDEVEQYAEGLIKEYQANAEQIGMDFTQFWKFVRERSVSGGIDEDPYLYAVKTAKKEIGTILWAGAMASYLGLDKLNSGTDDSAGEEHLSGDYEIIRQRYLLLEDTVVQTCIPALSDSRLSAEQYPIPEKEEEKIPDQTRRERKDVLRDIELLENYLEDETEGAFASAYCGYYTDDNRKLVILVLDPGEPAVLEEIRSIDLQTDYQITEGNYLYSHMVSLLEQIQEDLKALEIVCQAGSADEKTEALYEYRPYVLDSYAPSMGCIPVFFRNGPMTDDEKEKCSDLFEEVVGSFEEVFLSYGM
jgi:hypothetical protein